MKTSYRIKHALFPAILPVTIPTIGVPISLGTAWAIHAIQNLGLTADHLRSKRATPSVKPEGAGGDIRSQDEAVSRMPLNDFRPLPLDGYTSTGLRALPDIAPMYFDSGRRFRGRLHRYPRHFHETLIPTSGGAPISAIMGLHHVKLPRPGLVVVHGLMNSKRQDLVRVVTQRAFYSWGFNVCAVDLRGFGRSAESVSVPTGAGGIEAGDLLDVVRYLKKFPHFTSVGMLGYSLGAGACINAAATESAMGLLDGGVMAISPPLNLGATLDRFEHPPEDEEHLLTYHFFRFLLQRMLRYSELMHWAQKTMNRDGGSLDVAGFHDYLGNLVAWGYLGRGREKKRDPKRLLDLFIRVNSPGRSLSRVKVPTFVLSAKDDPLVPISDKEIRLLETVAAENKNLRHLITERGGHTAYVAVDQKWFYRMVRNYFTYWGDWHTEKIDPFLSQSLRRRERPKKSAEGGCDPVPTRGADDDGTNSGSNTGKNSGGNTRMKADHPSQSPPVSGQDVLPDSHGGAHPLSG